MAARRAAAAEPDNGGAAVIRPIWTLVSTFFLLGFAAGAFFMVWLEDRSERKAKP